MATRTPARSGPSNNEAERLWFIAATENEKAERAKFLVEKKNLDLENRILLRREAIVQSRTLVFSGEVEQEEVNDAVEYLRDLRAASLDPITVVLNSPGGDVFFGLLLFDILQEMRADGIEVTVKVKGLAASMGSVLAQAGDIRIASRNSWYMIHEPASFILGKAGDIKREAKLLEELHKQLCAIIAERSTLSAAEVARRSRDKDWWLPAPDAWRLGFFDEVR
jgi:ATP-dependent Clp endopeptidase proteolytic subunit ClpP